MCCGGIFSVIVYFVFGDAGVASWFVSRCVGPFGGLCRRRLIVVLVKCAYVSPGVLVRSVVRGLFGVGVGVGVYSGGGAWGCGQGIICWYTCGDGDCVCIVCIVTYF